jgi:hypothetical protein
VILPDSSGRPSVPIRIWLTAATSGSLERRLTSSTTRVAPPRIISSRAAT